MSQFANIGKAVLIQALGLQSNHVVEKEVQNFNNEACNECEHYHLIKAGFETDTHCQRCPFKQMSIVKVYVNEKNKYGYRPMLKANALKLLLAIHFFSPDKYGIVKNVSVRALSKQLGCEEKTIYNNLDILASYNYISFTHTRGNVNILLCDYKSYYLPAKEGGRGFLVMNEELLDQLMKISSINTLRIYLREVVEIDNLSGNGSYSSIEKSFKDIRRTLPMYCKKGIIKKALSNIGSIFNIEFKENSVKFHIVGECAAKKCKQDALDKYYNDLKDFFKEFNTSINTYNTHTHISDSMPYLQLLMDCDTGTYEARNVAHKNEDIKSMASLALQYSYEQVIDAYLEVYKTYISRFLPERNLGGLLRTIIESNIKQLQTAKLSIA